MATSYDRTSKLLGSYRLNLRGRSFSAVRALILDDLWRFTELGAHAYAADIRKALSTLEQEALAQPYVPGAHAPAKLAAFEASTQRNAAITL